MDNPGGPVLVPLAAAVAARLGLIGHAFWTNDWSARGNEDMGEEPCARAGSAT